MKEFLAALVGSIAGGVFALIGSFLASRWQAQHQRSNLLHEARIALYVDLMAECRRQDVRLDSLCGFDEDEPARPRETYRPTVPLAARVELLALPATRVAWEALAEADDRLVWAIDEGGYPRYEGESLSVNMPEVVALRRRVEGLREAVRRDLSRG
ncbi:hypothetical protein ACIBCR_15275 [Micromonospora echinospora]|uniref:hypothetical protein n=1 Tax=Micromonospora echinospora TaxID=1877 RepID=UPI00379104CF